MATKRSNSPERLGTFRQLHVQLPNSASAATQFYANMTANYTCVQASTNQVFVTPLAPGEPPPATAQYISGDCNQRRERADATTQTGWVHPNGKTAGRHSAPNFTAASPSSYGLNYWEPRFSGTYTINPETVSGIGRPLRRAADLGIGAVPCPHRR